jgi:hypothetical protein
MSTNRGLIQTFKRAKHECEEHLRRIEGDPEFRVFEKTLERGEVDFTQRGKDTDRRLIQRRIDRLNSAIDRLKSA